MIGIADADKIRIPQTLAALEHRQLLEIYNPTHGGTEICGADYLVNVLSEENEKLTKKIRLMPLQSNGEAGAVD